MRTVITFCLVACFAVTSAAQSYKKGKSGNDMPYVENVQPDERTKMFAKALSSNDTNRISEYFNAGVSINKCWDDDNNLSLLWYVINRCNKNTLGYVLRHGADPNLRVLRTTKEMFNGNISGYMFSEYPLETAFKTGEVQKIDLLIKYGANVNRCSDGLKKIAAESGNMQLINYLGKKTGTVAVERNSLALMTDYRSSNGGRNITTVLIEELLAGGADVNAISPNSGRTPLLNVIFSDDYKNRVTLVKFLLQHGADPNKTDNITSSGAMVVYPTSPLMAACRFGMLDEVKLLVEAGANVNERVGKGRWPSTPLKQAKTDEIKEYLVLHGAK